MNEETIKEYQPLSPQQIKFFKEQAGKIEDVEKIREDFDIEMMKGLSLLAGGGMGLASALTQSLWFGFLLPLAGTIVYNTFRDKIEERKRYITDSFVHAFDIAGSAGIFGVGMKSLFTGVKSFLTKKPGAFGKILSGGVMAGAGGLALSTMMQERKKEEIKKNIQIQKKTQIDFSEIDKVIAKMFEQVLSSILNDIEEYSIIEQAFEEELIDDEYVRQQGEDPEALRNFLLQVLDYYNNIYELR